jgi:hypothetical protein
VTTAANRRPVSVTLTTALLYLYGLATTAAGMALIWFRDQSLAQLPVLLARVDDSLPFGGTWEDWQYVAATGGLLVVVGVVVMVCAGLLSAGSRIAFVLLLAMAGLLAAGAIVVLRRVSDDLAVWAVDAVLVAPSVVLLVLLMLLAGPRSRRFIFRPRSD